MAKQRIYRFDKGESLRLAYSLGSKLGHSYYKPQFESSALRKLMQQKRKESLSTSRKKTSPQSMGRSGS